ELEQQLAECQSYWTDRNNKNRERAEQAEQQLATERERNKSAVQFAEMVEKGLEVVTHCLDDAERFAQSNPLYYAGYRDAATRIRTVVEIAAQDSAPADASRSSNADSEPTSSAGDAGS